MDKQKLLEELKKKMLADSTLPLKKGSTKLVFGDGDPQALILFIGEGPGYWEDQKGIPFVGNAGMLLNQMIKLLGVERKDVFVTNVVHHRPPENRDPLPEEINAYKQYLDKIIEIISPKVIVTLGRFSMAKFIPGVLISSVHGKPRQIVWNDKQIKIVPMYHPAAALRNGDVKRKLENDFLNLKGFLSKKDDEKKESSDEANSSVESKQMSLI